MVVRTECLRRREQRPVTGGHTRFRCTGRMENVGKKRGVSNYENSAKEMNVKGILRSHRYRES